MALSLALMELHTDMCSQVQPTAIKREKKEGSDDEEEEKEGKKANVHLVINMAVKLEPMSKDDTMNWTCKPLIITKKEEAKFTSKLEEDSDETVVDERELDSGTECGSPPDGNADDVDDDFDFDDDIEEESDSDEDEDDIVLVEDKLKEEEVKHMLSRCDLLMNMNHDPERKPDAVASRKWPIEDSRLQRKIKTMHVFKNKMLNERVKEVLLMPDSLQSMDRAVQYAAFIFWDKKTFPSSYMPDIMTTLPQIESGLMPFRNYKLFYYIFIRVLGFTSLLKFETDSIIDSIAAEVNSWPTWSLFSTIKLKRHNSDRVHKKTAKRSRRRESSDESDSEDESDEESDDELEPIRERCRKRLHRQPSLVSDVGEVRWPRVYDLKGSIREQAHVFNDDKLNKLIIRLLLTKKSRKSFSGAVDNLARAFWTREEIKEYKFPTALELLHPKFKQETCLEHVDKFYRIFMRIQGRYRSLNEFADTHWAHEVYRSFRLKFVREGSPS